MVDDAGFDLSTRSMLKDIFDAQSGDTALLHSLVTAVQKLSVAQSAQSAVLSNMAETLLSINANTAKSITNEGIIMSDTSALGLTTADLATQVAANTSVIGSADTMISGFAALLAQAVAAAGAAGATPEQLAALTALQTQVATDDAGLSAAIAANTPAAPPAA